MAKKGSCIGAIFQAIGMICFVIALALFFLVISAEDAEAYANPVAQQDEAFDAKQLFEDNQADEFDEDKFIEQIKADEEVFSKDKSLDYNDDSDYCEDYPCGHNKVYICHKLGTPAEHTLCISKFAVPAHLAHGDYCGQCIQALAIALSTELSSGVKWNITSLPVTNYPAIGNNGTNTTQYYVIVQAVGINADLYVKANGDLTYSNISYIPLANEKITYNTTDSNVPSGIKSSLTTNYVSNQIGYNMSSTSYSWLNFFLDVPIAQQPGNYNNTIYFKAVQTGFSLMVFNKVYKVRMLLIYLI